MGRSEVTFTNSTGAKIFVAYIRRDFGCLRDCEQPFEVRGWINLNPGETQTRANPTNNRWFYHYAEDENGRMWSGPIVTGVANDRFAKCYCIGIIPNPYHDVGFRILDTDTFSGVNYI